MDKLWGGILTIALIVVILGSMWFSWRMRQQKGAHAALPVVDLGAHILSARGLYVATTQLARPLERVALKGLTYRAQGLLAINEQGVALVLNGEGITTIPLSYITGIRTGQLTIDKVVEKDGLTIIDWDHPDEGALSSFFRIQSLAQRTDAEAALHKLLATKTKDQIK